MTRLALFDSAASTAPKTNGNGHAHVLRPAYDWEAAPAELLKEGRFVLYRSKPQPGGKKERKFPYQPKSPAMPAKINAPDTWSDFTLARAQYGPGHFDGLNFVTCPEFTVVDLDGCVNDGQISAEAKAVVAALPNSYWEYSPSRTGIHGIFRSAPAAIANISEKPVEVYAGNHFMSLTGWVLNDAPIAELKPEHVERYRAKKPRAAVSSQDADPIGAGQRTNTLLRMAGAMRRQGMSTEAIGQALWQTNLERCQPPLDKKGILKILQSARKWQAAELVAGERKDVGNADRLLRYGGGDYGYVAAFKRWVVFDGARWPVEDREQQTIRAEAHAMVRAYATQAAEAGKQDDMKFAAESLNSARISNLLREAEPHATIHVADLDRDPLLINFRNGTLDVRTLKLREHRREDHITAVIPHDYKPKATCPKWTKFVRATFGGDAELVAFVQRAHGYSLTGTTSEKCIFVAYGPTNTGKTTMLATVGALLGEYAGRLKVESLMVERGRSLDNNAQADLADLRGKRFVMTSETGEGQLLREGLIKVLSQGQGNYRAVRKYENPFDFPETWKIWMDCNHLPGVRDTDEAIWQRLIVVPFLQSVPKAKQNSKLSRELLDEEAEGILAWMVAGLRDWTKRGLSLPAVMRRQREEWRRESDTLGQWLEECCVRGTDAQAPSMDLYASHKQWRIVHGLREESMVAFAKKMKERFQKKNVGDKKVPHWLGLALRAGVKF